MNITVKTISKTELADLVHEGLLDQMFYQTAAGLLHIFTVNGWIYQTKFVPTKNIRDIAQKHIKKEDAPEKLLLVGTPFQHAVWQAALQIPRGKKVTYTDIASIVGKPKAVRAVANALGDNHIAYFIPCHRVIRKSGELCGYNWGVEKKEALLKNEGAL